MSPKPVRLNEAIRASQLRVIGEDGRQLGVLSRAEALTAARDAGLDLAEISSDANPPVAKIVDWGKYNYQRTKQQQKSKRNAKSPDMKQMRFGLKIGGHDMDVKLRKVNEFLERDHKVKMTIVYRGREMAHRDLGFKLAERLIERFGDTIAVDSQPQMLGKQLHFVIRKNSAVKPAKAHHEEV